MHTFRIKYSFIALLLTPLLLGALPTKAGPHRAVYIDDQPMGNSLTHIYWLRTLEDNRERYDNPLIHQFLVKQNIETGTIENHWLLRRLMLEARNEVDQNGSNPAAVMNVYEPPLDENEAKPIYQPSDYSLYRDAFAILRSEKVAPITSTDISLANSPELRWIIVEDKGLSYIDPIGVGGESADNQKDIRVDADDLASQIRTLLHPTIHEMKNFMRSGGDPRSTIPIKSLSVDLSLCSPIKTLLPHTTKRILLMQLDCEAEELISWYKVWIQIDMGGG